MKFMDLVSKAKLSLRTIAASAVILGAAAVGFSGESSAALHLSCIHGLFHCKTGSPAPTTAPATAGPIVYVQSFNAATTPTIPTNSITVTLGTAGTGGINPLTANGLVAIVHAANDAFNAPHPDTPGGWTAVAGGSGYSGFNSTIDAYYLPPGTTRPSSVVFTNFGGTNDLVDVSVTVYEATNNGGAEAIVSGGVAASGSTTDSPTTTGTGTATQTGEFPIIAGNVDDTCYSAGAVTGYTILNGGSQCLTGGGGPFGFTVQDQYGSDLGSTSVVSTTMKFTGSSGDNDLGMKVLLIPAAGTPGPSPSASATATASCSPATFDCFANGNSWPSTFVPYATVTPKSFWNVPVSNNPTIAAYSSTVIANQFPSGVENALAAQPAGFTDYSRPIYYATATDPLVTLHCNTSGGGSCSMPFPGSIHIPGKARPSGGNDAMWTIVQPDGSAVDMWATYGNPSNNGGFGVNNDMQTRDWQTGDTVTAATINSCGNYGTGSGVLASGGGSTAASFCEGGGQVSVGELISGTINHAISIGAQCSGGNGTIGGVFYPQSQYPSAGFTTACTSGIGPPLGGHLWYDVACSVTRTLSLQPWEKAILCALNQYGGYFGDNGSGGSFYVFGFLPIVESVEPYRDFHGSGTNLATYTNPYAALAAQGWAPVTIPNALGLATGTKWVASSADPGGDSWNIWSELGETSAQFGSHMHWLDPCAAHGTC